MRKINNSNLYWNESSKWYHNHKNNVVFSVLFGYDVKDDNWSSVNDDIAAVNEPPHELKKNKIVCHLNMLELSIITYNSILL